MPRRITIVFAGLCAAIPTFFVLQPADAGVRICYDVQVTVNGQGQAAAGCESLPEAPPPTVP